MAYKGKNPRPQNGNGNGQSGSGNRNNGNNNNAGMKQCNNCGPNKTHTTAECFKIKSKKPAGDSLKPPSRACSHCGGQHYDNQCPKVTQTGNKNQGKDQNQLQFVQVTGKTPSRACRHCGVVGHFDNACPSQNNGNQAITQVQQQQQQHGLVPVWQPRIQTINQDCPTCGRPHQASECPNKPATTAAPQYISSSTEVWAQLLKALVEDPGNAAAILGQYIATYPHIAPQGPWPPMFAQPQQEVQVAPLARWSANAAVENTQYADYMYEETGSFSQLSLQGQSQVGEGYVEVDGDGDVMMY